MSFATGITHGDCETGICPCKFVTTSMTVWTAAEHGNIDIIMAKYSKSPQSINKMDNYGYTPLHYAAQQNHHQIVHFLLTNGAQSDLQCCGATPLHRAAFSGCLESCKLLLASGADVNAQDYSFGDLNTPIQKAILQGHNHIVDLLLQHNNIDLSLENSMGLSAVMMLKNMSKSVNEVTTVETEVVPPACDLFVRLDKELPSVELVANVDNVSVPESKADSSTSSTINDTCCFVCKQSALSYSRTKFNNLICLSCKYQPVGIGLSTVNGGKFAAAEARRAANDDMWRSE
jgi:ankyrin repeat protein